MGVAEASDGDAEWSEVLVLVEHLPVHGVGVGVGVGGGLRSLGNSALATGKIKQQPASGTLPVTRKRSTVGVGQETKLSVCYFLPLQQGPCRWVSKVAV